MFMICKDSVVECDKRPHYYLEANDLELLMSNKQSRVDLLKHLSKERVVVASTSCENVPQVELTVLHNLMPTSWHSKI